MTSKIYPNKKKCKICGDVAVLIEQTISDGSFHEYYYHYSLDYTKGCRQRIPLEQVDKYLEDYHSHKQSAQTCEQGAEETQSNSD